MATYPFVAVATGQAASGGTITLSYQVASGRQFTINDIVFTSDGTFNLVNISSSRGVDFSNVVSAVPLLSTMLKLTTNQNNVLDFPSVPIVLMGGDVFSLQFLDTSGAANDITIALNGIMETK